MQIHTIAKIAISKIEQSLRVFLTKFLAVKYTL